MLALEQLFELADVVPERYRPMILLASFGSLLWGEPPRCKDKTWISWCLGGRSADVNSSWSRAPRCPCGTFTEVRGQGLVLGPPKSRAGVRTVSLPDAVVPALLDHLSEHLGSASDAPVFTADNGKPIWRGNFNKLVDWKAAVAKVGISGLHFHDLRHTGNTLAARTGASLADLMARMGHDSSQAAMIYRHKSREADRVIARALDVEVTKLKRGSWRTDTGARPATNRRGMDSA